MALVEARDLVKRFGSLTAVDGISFAVDRGEVVGFLGPNGAGKSTAMKIISGFLEPTSGQAWIDGHNSHTDPIAARRRLGYLPEGAPAYADMSVADFLAFIAAMHGMSKRRPMTGSPNSSSGSTSPRSGTSASSRCPRASSGASASPRRWCTIPTC